VSNANTIQFPQATGGTNTITHFGVYDAASGGNTATVSATNARYTRVGQKVTLWLHITDIDTTGMTGANNLVIQGLPFTAGNDVYAAGSVILDRFNYTGDWVNAYIIENFDVMYLAKNSTGQDALMTVSEVASAGSDIQALTISYYTDD